MHHQVRAPAAAARVYSNQATTAPVLSTVCWKLALVNYTLLCLLAVLQVLIADFFFVLAVLGWLGAGLAGKAMGSSALIDAWMPLWPMVFQPAIGILMAGALVSGGLNWLAEQQQQKS